MCALQLFYIFYWNMVELKEKRITRIIYPEQKRHFCSRNHISNIWIPYSDDVRSCSHLNHHLFFIWKLNLPTNCFIALKLIVHKLTASIRWLYYAYRISIDFRWNLNIHLLYYQRDFSIRWKMCIFHELCLSSMFSTLHYLLIKLKKL